MILQISLVLLIFFFFFLTYMVTKGWRWFHVVCLVAVFFNAIAFLFFAAFTLKTQATWRYIYNTQTTQLEKKLQDKEEALHGKRNELLDAEDSLRSLNNALARAVIDRGRVWRDCVPQNVSYDQASGLLTVQLGIPPRQAAAPAPAAPAPAADPNDPAAAPAPAPAANQAALRHLMQQKIILFAFMEASSPSADGVPDAYKVPSYFVGEYFATAVTPTTVTLQSVIPPTGKELQAAQSRASTWVLYEVMPRDGHKYFLRSDGSVDDQYVRSLLSPQRTWLTEGIITQAQYDTMIQEYLRDGQAARDEDPPERKWVRVEFVQDYDVRVNADAPDILTIDNFDSQGLARNIQLMQRDTSGSLKDTTSFAPGETVVMDSVSANQLEQQGVVKKVEEIYVRELRDYEYSFQKIRRRIVDLNESIRNTDSDIVKANEAIAKIRHQIAYREDEKAKLIEDLGYVNDEVKKLEDYIAKLTAYQNNLNRTLSSLYQHSNALEIQLGEMQASLADLIEARAARAVAEVGTGAGAGQN